MPPAERRAFTGAMSEIIATARWLDEIAVRNDLPGEAVFALHICAEEILTNIVRHSGSAGPSIEVGVSVTPQKVELTVDDDGEPYDLTRATPRKVSGDILSVEPGGLGVQLIHQFASDLDYSRGSAGNHLKVTIDVDRAGQSIAAQA